MNSLGRLEKSHILLLQGPMGYFFKHLDLKLRTYGAITYKVGLNAGDKFFANRDNYCPYRGTRENWPHFIENFLKTYTIDKLFIFGDCRYYQSIAIQKAKSLNITVYVFEEGYIRPHYITLEKCGVNDHSTLSRDPSFYKGLPEPKPREVSHAQTSRVKMVFSASTYYFLGNLFHFRYPHYQHHRDFSALQELFYGLRGALRKVIYPLFEKKHLPRITGKLSKRYFFIPIQTHNDYQIVQHSHFASIEKFIVHVLTSYAQHTSKKDWLLFKHHPVDRGRKHYTQFIVQQAKRLGIEHKVIILHDTHLPTCIKHAKGTITVNSTVGLSAVGHGIPTITLGKALYNMEGLTNYGKSLENFWHEQTVPDHILYSKYREYIIEHSQLNGSFYGRFPDLKIN
jgi:capsular polysaccharide export protein